MDNEIEIWKDVGVVKGVDFSGYFEVSTFGNVRGLDRWITTKDGRKAFIKGSDKKSTITPKGYKLITLSKNGNNVTLSLHRLVLNTFKPNPNPEIYTDVNHIDEDKTNNHLNNLEWTTHRENMNYGTRNKRVAEKKGTAIIQLSKDGTIIRQWDSFKDIKKGMKLQDNIIKNEIKKYGIVYYNDYIWTNIIKYENLTKNDIENSVNKYILEKESNSIVQLNLDGTFVKEWSPANKLLEEFNNFDIEYLCYSIKRNKYFYRKYLWINSLVYKNISNEDLNKIVEDSKRFYTHSGHNKKQIIQIDKNCNILKQWDTVKAASKDLHLHKDTISLMAKSKYKRNDYDIIIMFLEDYNNVTDEELKNIINDKQTKINNNYIKIVQLTLNNEFVKEWDSARDVVNELHINAGNISSCLKGRYSQTGGFKWVYSKDYYAQ